MTATAYDSATRSRLRSLNCDGRRGRALLLALLLLLGLAVGGEPWRAALQYQRGAIATGEWWRLVTAHLVHLNARHLLLDGAGLVLLWVLYARALPAVAWLGVLAAAVLAIDAGLWWLSPLVQWYVGLSGVLHGAWAAGAVGAWREDRGLAAASLGLLGLKLAAEQWQHGGVAGSGLPVVVDAHLYGAAGGLLAALASAWRARRL
jgi:rhomboid family GlyGly-CTERM serine protease